MEWQVVFLNEDVRELLDALAIDLRASFQRIVELIETHGLERVREPYVRHLQDKLWEIRMKAEAESHVLPM